MMTTTTERILDLVSAAARADDEDLLRLLQETSELYQQGFEELRRRMTTRFEGLVDSKVAAAVVSAGLPYDSSQERDELLVLLALLEWEMTPSAMAYAQMAEDAARRGVCLIPEA
ncbi:hypothetical protein [Streptomyces flavofungini]|uniref:Uncharacterized protein n=1 Tax=Streptomyces flavofungini TaxID=68200 RepID=A0ABS0XGG8_9ACTN|nr:hypothetical protein [Streptomyces flavofungini]MBJ3812320.1 hypothetical protein [Streptomyces flavofungini]GHC88467.1 hypothetical protein GCM10010349_75770 [Streptomyces flavofungini]